MKLGIIGIPQCGKKIIFELLTGTTIPEHHDGSKPIAGIAAIRDARFDKLVALYKPKSAVPAKIDLQLLPKIDQNALKDREMFRHLGDMDALCLVVRVFADESVYHPNGSVDPARDIEFIHSELVLNDLIFIEKRQERMQKDAKKKKDHSAMIEEELLARMQAHLNEHMPLRTLAISPEEKKVIAGYPFLTLKKLIAVLNVSDADISKGELPETLLKKFAAHGIDIMQVSAKLETEIASLESDAEKKEFMDASGISEPALNVLTQHAMKSLGLISYFTVGEDEVRQWLVRSGAFAPEAAGVIHSDIERGFIRAEVMKYADLMELGDEDKVKKAGKFHVMGKDYLVVDGDIMSFRFNV